MNTITRKDVRWPFFETTIVVVNDSLISMASFERMFQTTRRTLERKLTFPRELIKLKKRVYDETTSGYLHLFVTKQGLENYMSHHINWKPETIRKGMRMVFGEWNGEEEEEEEAPERVEISLSDESSPPPSPKVTRVVSRSPPLRKRVRSVEDKLDSFMDEMRSIVHQRAQLEYQQSPQFKEDCEALVNKRVDDMLPEIREQLRRELEPEVRASIAKRLREDEVLVSLQKEESSPPFHVPLPDTFAPQPEDFMPVTDWRSYRVTQ